MPKPKCTRELVDQAVKLKKGGANNQDIAKAVGIAESTFYKWISEPKREEEAELSEALKKAEADYKNALQGLIAKAAQERDWKAAAWLLERKYPDEFGRKFISASIEGNIGVGKISPETYERVARALEGD